MKVLHLIPSIAAVRGGPSLATIEMVNSLRGFGVESEIAATNDNGDVTLLDIQLNVLSEYQGVPVRFFERFSPPFRGVREYAFSFGLTVWLWQNLHRYDLVHVHAIFSYTSTVGMFISRIKKIPYINSPHGLLCQWSLQQGKLKKDLYLSLIEKDNLLGAKAIHVTAIQEQKEVNLLGLNLPIRSQSLGLDMPIMIADAREKLHQTLNISIEIPIILFLSRLHPKKGLDYLIRALSKLRAGNRNFAFVLAGSGTPEYEVELDGLIEKNNLSDLTYKLGFVSGEKKNICLQGADLYALTSHSENFGIAVLEALASGTPALVTNGVALSDLVREQTLGWVVDLEIEAIAKSIEDFLDNPETARLMGNRAAQYIAQHYAWDSVAKGMAEIYENVLLSKS